MLIYFGIGVERSKNAEGLWVYGGKVLQKTEAPLLVRGRSVEWVCAIDEVVKRKMYIIYKIWNQAQVLRMFCVLQHWGFFHGLATVECLQGTLSCPFSHQLVPENVTCPGNGRSCILCWPMGLGHEQMWPTSVHLALSGEGGLETRT